MKTKLFFIKNKKLIILILVVLISLICLFLTLYPFYLTHIEDKFYPYWDPYATKYLSLSLNKYIFPLHFADPLFYYFVFFLNQICKIEFYTIIKFGNIAEIVLIITVLYLYLKNNNHKKISTPLIFFCIFYYLNTFQNRMRFSMTLRENLILPFLFFYMFLLDKIIKFPHKKKYIVPILVILLIFITGSHFLVSFFAIGITIILLIRNCFLSIREMLIAAFFYIVGISPFLSLQINGIYYQLTKQQGKNYLSTIGKTVQQGYLQLSKFNSPHDLIIFIFLIIFFIFSLLNKHKQKKIFPHSIVSMIWVLFIFLSIFRVGQFGFGENRFVIYINFLLIYTLFIILSSYKNYYIKLGLIFLIIINTVSSSFLYHAYRPLNFENVNFVENLFKNGKLNNKSPVYCQQSSCNALKYINPNTEILSITNDNILKIKFGTDQVLIFYEDWMKNKNSNNILFKELSRNKNYLLIEPKLDKIINKQQ